MLHIERHKAAFRKAVDEFNKLVARGEFGQAAVAAGRAGKAAATLQSMTGGSPDWRADARRWQIQQGWAREMQRGA